MLTDDSFTPTSHHYLIRDRGMGLNKKHCHLFSIVEENSDVCISQGKTRTHLGISKLLLKDSTNNIHTEIRQLRFHRHPVCAILSASNGKTFHRVGTIKRKSVRSELRHYTVDSIYGQYDFIETKDPEPLFLLTKDERLIAHCSRIQHVSIDNNIENEQIRQFVLALFALILGC